MLEHDQILDISDLWSQRNEDLSGFVQRRVTLPKELQSNVCLAIQGVRRCGKSTLMHQLIQQYRLEPNRCAFLNFEDPRLVNHLNTELLTSFVDAFRARHRRVKRLYFFLDEIQLVPQWEKWMRMQLDTPNDNYFIVTGSNASMLSGELSSALTGRHLKVELMPFSFAEANDRQSTSLEDYLRFGGFPDPSVSPDGDLLLQQYFLDIVERDVRERVGATSAIAVRQVAQMVYESAGSELSLRRIAGAVGLAVETAQSYVEGCKSAYLFFECPYFAFNERKRASRNKKYYPVDTALRRVNVTPTGADLGKALECAVFLALRQRHNEVYYWRGKGEVDFVVREGNRVFPFQVTWHEPTERHHDALDEFYEAFPTSEEATFVTVDTFNEILNL